MQKRQERAGGIRKTRRVQGWSARDSVIATRHELLGGASRRRRYRPRERGRSRREELVTARGHFTTTRRKGLDGSAGVCCSVGCGLVRAIS